MSSFDRVSSTNMPKPGLHSIKAGQWAELSLLHALVQQNVKWQVWKACRCSVQPTLEWRLAFEEHKGQTTTVDAVVWRDNTWQALGQSIGKTRSKSRIYKTMGVDLDREHKVTEGQAELRSMKRRALKKSCGEGWARKREKPQVINKWYSLLSFSMLSPSPMSLLSFSLSFSLSICATAQRFDSCLAG